MDVVDVPSLAAFWRDAELRGEARLEAALRTFVEGLQPRWPHGGIVLKHRDSVDVPGAIVEAQPSWPHAVDRWLEAWLFQRRRTEWFRATDVPDEVFPLFTRVWHEIVGELDGVGRDSRAALVRAPKWADDAIGLIVGEHVLTAEAWFD